MPSTTRRRLTADDLWALKRVGAPVPRPDGRGAVVPVGRYDMKDNKGRTRLMLVPADGGPPQPLTAEEFSSDQAVFHPDGRRIAFVRRRDGEKPQVYVMSIDGGEAQKMTDMPLGAYDPQWFPDGRLAFLSPVIMEALITGVPEPIPGAAPSGAGAAAGSDPAPAAAGSSAGPAPNGRDEPATVSKTRDLIARRDAEPVKAKVTEDRVFRFWDNWITGGEVPHVFVLDLETCTLTDLTPESTSWFDFMDSTGQYDIAPDGSEIAWAANASTPPHHRLNWDIFLLPVTKDASGATVAGAVKNITRQNPADDVRPRYTPDGAAIVYGMQRDPFFYADTVRLVRYDRKAGTHTVLTEAWDRSPAAWEFAPDGKTLFVLAEEDARVNLFALSLTGGLDVKKLVTGGTLSGLSVAADGRPWFTVQNLSRPAEAAVCNPDGSEFREMTRVNAALLSEIDFGLVEEKRFKGADGKQVQMFVAYPPGFDPKKKWPLVQMIHGGPHGISGDGFHWRWNAHLFAAPGYIVAMVNFHGSTSYGQDFAASILGAHGDKPFADIMASTDALIAEGYVDETKMAATGGSYGGYLVTWIAGHTDRFACIVNHAGVFDLLGQYASDVSQGRHVAYGGEPWDGLENIDRWSPNRFATGFTTPMLILHGEKDYRVPYTQGLEVYGMYKAKGVDARLVVYPDENHWILQPRNSRHWYGEVHAWLKRYLG